MSIQPDKGTTVNREELIRVLRLMFHKGDVFEIRVLNATTFDHRQPHTESGYYDYEHIPQVPEAIAKLRSYTGAYVTLNPVDPDLLARSFNHLSFAKNNLATSDADIIKRRWLLIDCDPVRKSNISSTEAEHTAALCLADEIRAALTSEGWPEPIALDSGNGAHMLYRIDLPAEDNGLVKRVIAAIAEASTDKVHVDTTVYNPARIFRLPGTMNCKGDNVPFRPHRMAEIRYVPKQLECVSEELLLKKVACLSQIDEVKNISCFPITGLSWLDDWIAKYCPDLGEPVPYQGGRKWLIKECPFNPAHNDHSAVLIELPSGAVRFKCHHKSCVGNDWPKFRKLMEGMSSLGSKNQEIPSNNAGNNTENAITIPEIPINVLDEIHPNPGELPEELTHIPGFIDDYTQWIMDTAPRPNRVLAFCASLAFLSFITGRTVRDERDNQTNLYLVALANSGAGKDHPRKCNAKLAKACMLGSCMADEFGSGQGLEDSLFIHSTMLYQIDEFDTLINSLHLAKDQKGENSINRLLRLYSSVNGVYSMRKLAFKHNEWNDRERIRQMEEGRNINNPHLVIFGTAIPKFFYQSLTPRMLNNGLLARCLVVHAGRRGPGHKPKNDQIPISVINAVNMIKKYSGYGNLDTLNPQLVVIKATDEADRKLQQISEFYDSIYDRFETLDQTIAMTIWARVFEKVCKLALIHAISMNPEQPVIQLESVEWANKFVDFLTRQMLYLVNTYSYENEFDEKCKKIMRYLRECGGRCPHSALLKRSHESKDFFRKIMDTLIDNGSVAVEMIGKNNHTTQIYHIQCN